MTLEAISVLPMGQAWYAVAVRPHHEKVVAAGLRARGYREFLPLYQSDHRSGRRTVCVSLPLFSGYVFSAFRLLDRLPVLTIPGVLHIVGNGKVPASIDTREIAAIHSVVRSGLDARPESYLTIGEPVFIDRGPLRGLEGLLIGLKGKNRLVVSISMLRRAISVEIDSSSVRRIATLFRPLPADAPAFKVLEATTAAANAANLARYKEPNTERSPL